MALLRVDNPHTGKLHKGKATFAGGCIEEGEFKDGGWSSATSSATSISAAPGGAGQFPCSE